MQACKNAGEKDAGEKDAGEKEVIQKEVIQKQLTLKAVIWNVPDGDPGLLEQEAEDYGVMFIGMDPETIRGNTADKYGRMLDMLFQAGVPQPGAVLVTQDVQLVKYMQQKQTGIAVVFYERQEETDAGNTMDIAADFIVQGFEETGVQFFDRIQKRKNRLPWNILYTKRTCVREITLDDLEELFELYGGKGITDFTEPLYERQKEEEYTKNYIDYMYRYYGYGMWVVRHRESGRLLGRAGIGHREEEGRVLMELGYIIGCEYQNQGYATEVCEAVMEYAAVQLQTDELHCMIHPQNYPSLRVARKLGFTLVNSGEPRRDGLLHYHKRL